MIPYLFDGIVHVETLSLGGEEEGALKKHLYGEASPRGPTPCPFIYHFWQKRYLFVYLPLTTDTQFIYLANRKSSCHFHAAFNKLKQYSHKVCVFELI